MEHILYLFSALALGALHALEPGHGKTLIAAYIVGNRGTVADAVKLGAIVTFTHTLGVIVLGLMLVFFSSYFLAGSLEKSVQILSSVIVLAVGIWLLIKAFFNKNVSQSHDHAHHHHGHAHHDHAHEHNHEHADAQHECSKSCNKGLLWLGVSGGIVPCHGALAVLLGTIASGGSAKIFWGVLMVLFFSLGLAVVVMVLSIVAAKISSVNWLERVGVSNDVGNKIIQKLPLVTALIILGMGIFMTANSLGLSRSNYIAHQHRHLL